MQLTATTSITQRITSYVAGEFAANIVDGITAELVDVATGARSGSTFERDILARILPATETVTVSATAVCTFHVLAYVRPAGTRDLFRPRRFDVDAPADTPLADLARRICVRHAFGLEVERVERATFSARQAS